ncbi:acyl-CoA dehydrogenase family protein [Sphingobacterium sp. Mn56C]|uniref:acyl-CoA dehydrogenase family protein n=1 Tax=Sphingobacterium sp. Mn56C TaxID=3395261 RepID=UPI003BE93B8D
MLPYYQFLKQFSDNLHQLFTKTNNIDQLSTQRGLDKEMWSCIMKDNPLSVAIPTEFGGRGVQTKECLGILAAAAYESLPLSLTFGINIALFLEPLAKYGGECKAKIFNDFLTHKSMGGLMITEPEHGTDALHMQTSFTPTENGYHLSGQKHWQGLTGLADFWIVAAREKSEDGKLSRDVDFFVVDNANPEQQIQVTEYYKNLGLYMIPYGRNLIDIDVPADQKLIKHSSGIKMMLDILHRSRLQFAGMGMGFIQRLLDETLAHCTTRKVGSQKLIELDNVRYQLSRIQAAFTLCSGMCANSVAKSSIDHDLSDMGLEANCTKAFLTDLMQESAQIAVQLAGANGYKLDTVVGRSILDSRAFQIFEGANELLYTQVAEAALKQMRVAKAESLAAFLIEASYTQKSAPLFKDLLRFNVSGVLKQRQQVAIGKVIARLVCFQYVQDITEKGFREDLYASTKLHIEMDIKELLCDLEDYNNADIVEDYKADSDWLAFV